MFEKVMLLPGTYLFYIHYISFVVTAATFVCGVISWCIIKKFRDFSNYIYLNAILANTLLYSVSTIIMYKLHDENGVVKSIINSRLLTISFIVFTYLLTARNHWFLIILHNKYYVDILQVFNGYTQRKYLRTSLFGWGVAFVTTLIWILVIYFSYVSTNRGILLLILLGSAAIPCLYNFILYIVFFRKYYWCKIYCYYITKFIFLSMNFLLISNHAGLLLLREYISGTLHYFIVLALDIVLIVVNVLPPGERSTDQDHDSNKREQLNMDDI